DLAVLTKPTCREVHRCDHLVHRFLGRDQRLGPGHDDPKRAAEGAIVRDAEDGGAHFLTCERRSAMASTGQSSTARWASGSRGTGTDSEVATVRAVVGDPGARVRERPQTEKARTALRRALGGEVAHDAGRLTDGTGARGEQSDHAATKPRAVVERQLPGFRRLHPRTEVT